MLVCTNSYAEGAPNGRVSLRNKMIGWLESANAQVEARSLAYRGLLFRKFQGTAWDERISL